MLEIHRDACELAGFFLEWAWGWAILDGGTLNLNMELFFPQPFVPWMLKYKAFIWWILLVEKVLVSNTWINYNYLVARPLIFGGVLG